MKLISGASDSWLLDISIHGVTGGVGGETAPVVTSGVGV